MNLRTSPLMFGMLLDWTLFGVLPVQVCKPAPLPFKAAPTTYAMQTFITFASLQISECSNDLFCAGYGNLITLSNAYIPASYGLMMSAVISVTVQWFFCYRICSLSKSWLLASLISAISLMQGVASLIIGIQGHIVGNFSVACAHIDLVALYMLRSNIVSVVHLRIHFEKRVLLESGSGDLGGRPNFWKEIKSAHLHSLLASIPDTFDNDARLCMLDFGHLIIAV
ncbi:hypothetical protein JB92DRAFT_3272777 [Gautieria morchelliformis]|nr:hypothetical protein JB92DRAFT_3272777 [Gautieria morchelliformis]